MQTNLHRLRLALLAFAARDAYGFSLNYYTTIINTVTVNDYKAINGTVSPFTGNVFSLTNTDAATVAKPLFNGNIAAMMVNIPKLGNAQLYGYAYDQLNRILSMDAFNGFNNSNNTFTPTASSNYKERITYDANGNIKTYLRNGTTTGGTPLAMDNLTYAYNMSGGKLVNNKLRHVQDAVGDANYAEDIDNQSTDNYEYDAVGNLIKDTKEGISNISWSVYGKILSVTKSSGTIIYTYDANGNRTSKTFNGKTTWYVRDASGNVMSIYEQRSDLNGGHLTQTEVHKYGSSRLAVMNINRDMITPAIGEITIVERGKTIFELTNHLGNVLVTVSDRKIQVDTNSDGVVDYYMSDVAMATDYYPFGLDMPSRRSGNGSRYGFNGKERDKDIHSLTVYDYGFRIYNPAIGKFLSVDPLTAKFPWYTPYQFAGNKPIIAVDLDGLEDKIIITDKFIEGAKKAVSVNDAQVKNAVQKGHRVIMKITLATGPDNFDTREVVYNEGTISSDVGFIDFSSNGINSQWTFHYEEPDPIPRLVKPGPVENEIGIIGINQIEPIAPPTIKEPTFTFKKIKSKPTGKETEKIKKTTMPPKKNKPPVATPPKPKEPKLVPLTIASDVLFEPRSRHFDDKIKAEAEADKIVALVRGAGVTDYSITVVGNFQGGGTSTWGGWDLDLRVMTVYDTYGEIGQARATALKDMLVKRGIDPNKIKTALGDPNKKMTADYKVTLTKTE